MQGCALAMSGSPLQRLTFTLGRLGILSLFQSNQMLGTLGFTGSEY